MATKSTASLLSLLRALNAAGVERRTQMPCRNATALRPRCSVHGSVARKRLRACSTGTGLAGAVRRNETPTSSSTRRSSLVMRRIRDLRRLVPVNSAGTRQRSSAGNVGSFLREAADYIACLRLQVKVMRAMVDALSEHSDV